MIQGIASTTPGIKKVTEIHTYHFDYAKIEESGFVVSMIKDRGPSSRSCQMGCFG
jgi:hypothetical protein